MHRKAMIAALIAATAPALALGQHPADSASAHPASNAHANAVAGQASALRLETCDDLSSAMLGALEKGDFKTATSKFDDQMLATFGPQKLGALWESESTQFGVLQSRGFPQAAMYQDLFIVVTPLYFEKGTLTAQVVCDMDGKIVGFHIRPLAPAASH